VITAVRSGSFAAFLGTFLVLFALAGVGNGTTYRMIPAIFRSQSEDPVTARRHSAAALGPVSAVGAYGGFLVPRSFGLSVAHTGGIEAALIGFVAFYGVCTTVTWWCYLRRRVLAARLPSLAHAGV
jgi:NNP family nitrate/nitrite transporter-like MFS transporter